MRDIYRPGGHRGDLPASLLALRATSSRQATVTPRRRLYLIKLKNYPNLALSDIPDQKVQLYHSYPLTRVEETGAWLQWAQDRMLTDEGEVVTSYLPGDRRDLWLCAVWLCGGVTRPDIYTTEIEIVQVICKSARKHSYYMYIL